MAAQLAFAGALVLVAPQPAVADTGSGQSRTLLEQAREALAKNDLPTAIIRLKNAARIDPDNLQVRMELGRASLRTGDYIAAEKEFERVMQGGPSVEATLSFGEALLRQAKYDAVLAKLQVSGSDAAVNAAVRAKRGAAMLGLGRVDDAVTELKASVSGKETAEAQATLARALQRKGDAAGADAAINAALRLEPDQADALLIKGQMRAAARDMKTAEQLFTSVLAKREDSIEARIGRAAARLDQGNQEGANSDLDLLLKRQPRFGPAIYYKALAAVRRNDAKAAQDFIDQLPSTFVDSSRPAQMLAASVALSNGKQTTADALATKAQLSDPDDPTARQLLGAIRLRGGKPLDTIALLEPLATGAKAASLDPGALRQLSEGYLAVGRVTDALDLQQRALAGSPDNAALASELAAVQLRTGRNDEAVKTLEALITRDPAQTDATVTLLNIYLQQGATQKAGALLPKLRQQLPNSPAPDYYAALLAQQTGKFSEARTGFEGVIKRYPDFTQASMALAALEQTALRPDAARQALQAVISRDPANERAMTELSAMALNRGKRAEAIDWLQKAVAANPKSVQARLTLMNRLLDIGEVKAALAQGEEGMRQTPEAAQISDRYGAALFADNKKSEAINHYRSMVQRYPDTPLFLVRLAEAQRAEDPQGAERSLLRAIELAPTDLDLRVLLVQFLLSQNQPEKAIDAARQTQAAIASPNAKQLLPDVFRRLGRIDELRSYLELEFARNPKEFALALQLADIAYSQKTLDAGAAWLAKAVAADPQSLAPRLGQIDRLLVQGDMAKATVAIDDAAKQFPANPELEDRRGRMLMTSGKPAEAARVYAKLAEAAPPGAALPFVRQAETLAAAGDPVGARKAFDRAIQTAPTDLRARGRLTSFLIAQKQPDAALAAAAAAVTDVPGAGSLGLLGETQIALGRFADAAKTFAEIDAAAPNAPAMSQRIIALFSAKEDAAAIAAAADWSNRFPDDPTVPLVLAERYLQSNRMTEGAAIYDRLLAKAPNDPRLLNNLAWAIKDIDLKRATALADRAFQAQPTSSAIADTFGVILTKAGDHARAVEVLRQAASAAPNDLSVQLHLAQALAGAGDKTSAILTLRPITASDVTWSGRDEAVALLKNLSAN